MTEKFNINELWIAFGTGTTLRYLAVHKIVSRLGSEKARSLPVFHALTGCDTVSLGKGRLHGSPGWLVKKQTLLSMNCLTTQM